MTERMRHPLRALAVVAVVAGVSVALAGPPLVPRSDADQRPDESSGFRYLPGAAFGITELTQVTAVESRQWTGTFAQGERFELLSERLPTGRYYLEYSLSGELETAAPARLECGLSEAQSGITLEPQPELMLQSGDEPTEEEGGAVFDLPGMTVSFSCVIDSLVFGSIDIDRAELSVFTTP